jgi:hypothetical protein
MGLLDDIMGMDAAFALSGDLVPGTESVTVTTPAGVSRSIHVAVNRNPPERLVGGSQVMVPLMEVSLPNSATVGISSTEFDPTGVWSITIAREYGGTPETFHLFLPPPGVAWCDAGTLLLHVR